MENKDIILIILVIIVLYLLFCNMNNKKQINELKENFTTEGVTTTGVTTTANPVDEEIKNKIEQYLSKREGIPVSESIKNLGIIAKKLQERSFLTVPGDFKVDGNLLVNGNIQLSKNIDGEDRFTTLSLEKSKITKELQELQDDKLLKLQEESHSLNIDSSIKFTNDSSNGLRFPLRNDNSQSAIYQKPGYGNLHIYSADSYINLQTKTAVKDELLFLGDSKLVGHNKVIKMEDQTIETNEIKTNKLVSNNGNGKINMPNQIITELGGIEKLKFITPYYDFAGKKVPDTANAINVGWNKDHFNKYIKMALEIPNSLVFAKYTEQYGGGPFILSINKDFTDSGQQVIV